MRAKIASVLAAGMLLMGCASRPAPPSEAGAGPSSRADSPRAQSVAEAPPVQAGLGIGRELLAGLYDRYLISKEKGLDAAGGLGTFLADHPDFLYNRAVKSKFPGKDEHGEPFVFLYEYEGLDTGEDLLNRERLARFMENVRAGTPDEIAVISSGDPVPLWVTVFSFDGEGYTMESFAPVEAPQAKGSPDGGRPALSLPEETAVEWRMLLGDERFGYPKYGYEPVLIDGEPRDASPEEAKAAVERWVGKNMPNHTAEGLERLERAELDGESCYVFQAGTGQDRYAVRADLGRFYVMEHAEGRYLLLARPADKPA